MAASRRDALRGLSLIALAPVLPACSVIPVLPARPEPAEAEGAAGWVGLTPEGQVVLHAPRQEMGQGVVGALRRIVAAELDIRPEAIEVRLPDTAAMPPVRATVGSESLQLFAEPLSRAAAALREELARSPPGAGRGAPVVLSAAAVRAARPRGAAIPAAPRPEPELAALLRGAPVFAGDALPDGLLHGAVLRPPRLGASLVAAAPGRAMSVPGVVAFVPGDGWAGVVAERPGALARAVEAVTTRWEGGSAWGAAGLARAVDVEARLGGRGGASGGRTVPNVEIEAARLARAVAPRPVLVQWSRADEFREAFHRPPSTHRIRARLGAKGRVAAWWHAFVSGHVIFAAAVLPAWLQRAANAVTGDAGIARGARPPYAFGAALRHVSTEADPPSAAEDLLVLGVYLGLLRAIGCEGVSAEVAGGCVARAEGGWDEDAARRAIAAGDTAAWRLSWTGWRPIRIGVPPAGAPDPHGAPAVTFDDCAEAAGVAALLAEDPARPLSLAEAATGLGLSPRALQRRLAAHGLSVTAVARAVQIRHACALLAGSDEPLPAIGYVCGFSDQAHFTRTFRKRVNMTPGAYRAAQKRHLEPDRS